MIGLYADYSWSTATRWAVAVASIVESLGETVSWIAPRKGVGVNGYWDSRVVVPTSSQKAFDWLTKCRYVISTEYEWAFAKACYRYQKVPIWLVHDLVSFSKIDFPLQASKIVCTTATSARAFDDKTGFVRVVPCEPCLPIELAHDDPGEMRAVCVVVPRDLPDFYAMRLFYSWNFFLTYANNVTLTFVHNRRWPLAANKALDDLQISHNSRVTVYRKLTHQQELQIVAEHDTLFYPYSSDEFYLPVYEAICGGVPVVTFRSRRFEELFEHEKRVRMCDTKRLKNSGLAKPTLAQIFGAVTAAASAPLWAATDSWLVARQMAAKKGWAELLDIPFSERLET